MTGAGPPADTATAPPEPRGERGAVASAWLWTAGALLASAALGLLATLPALPASAEDALGWVDAGSFQLTWAGELLFVATILWGTGAAGALGAHGTGGPVRRRVALVALGIALVAFVVVLLALGRLVYPVVDIRPGAETVVLLTSIVVGTVHLALLALAVVAVALPVPAGSARARRAFLVAGTAFAVLFVVGSYPWLLPTWFNLVVAGAVGCWGALVGAALLARDRRRAPHQEGHETPSAH